MKKTRYIILSPIDKKQPFGGVVIVESVSSSCTGFVSLFGIKDPSPILLVDDMVQVRQFEIAPGFSEIDFDEAIASATDLVVGLFDKNKRLIASGSTFGTETEEQRQRLEIALEKRGSLEHFKALAKDVFAVQDELNQTQQREQKTQPCAKDKRTFFEQMQMVLLELFACGVPDSSLCRFVPNSKWVKLFLKTDVVGVGVVEKDGLVAGVGLAFPVLSRTQKHPSVDKHFTFFAQNAACPHGFGYWVVVQSAKDGSVVEIKSQNG